MVTLLALWVGLANLSACSQATPTQVNDGEKDPEANDPPRLAFLKSISLADQGFYTESNSKLETITQQQLRSLLGSYAELQLGEVNFLRKNWDDSKLHYQLFLSETPNSNLSSYVLRQLIQVQHNKSLVGLFTPQKDIERDMSANRALIQAYNRFYFAYPNSVHLPEVRQFKRAATQALAQHEKLVGDFYFDNNLYAAATRRYLFLLKYHPNSTVAKKTLLRMIEAHQRLQENELAQQWLDVYQQHYGTKPPP